MTAEPQTWHYGLVARYWAEHNTGGSEIAYYRKKIEKYGQPALDAGCGTGRLLIPFLQAGLDVDGCDVSPDMLAGCKARAEREGLEARLYAQALHKLKLPRRYQVIYSCGVFGIGATREQDLIALQRFHDHLKPGGVLLLDHEMPYADLRSWPLWQKDARGGLPEPWPELLGKEPPEDGSEYQLYARITALDPLEQRITREMRTLLWQGGRVAADEVLTLTENRYFRNELRRMLEETGFAVESIEGDYTEAEAGPEHVALVFIARRA